MKRKFVVVAMGGSTSTKCTIDVKTDASFTRAESNHFALDVMDEVIKTLAAKYRLSKIKVVRGR